MTDRRQRLTATARRAQLIEVGRGVFAKRGYKGASLEEIADKAKVTRPIVYEHFGGKEGLFAVIVDREIEYLVRRIAEAITSGTMRDRVEQAALAFFAYVHDQPEGFAVLTQDAPVTTAGGGMSSLITDVAERVSEQFTVAFKEAGFEPKAAPIYAHALIGMVTFVGQWWSKTKKPSVEEVAGHVSALAWMGLRHLPKKPKRLSKRT